MSLACLSLLVTYQPLAAQEEEQPPQPQIQAIDAVLVQPPGQVNQAVHLTAEAQNYSQTGLTAGVAIFQNQGETRQLKDRMTLDGPVYLPKEEAIVVEIPYSPAPYLNGEFEVVAFLETPGGDQVAFKSLGEMNFQGTQPFAQIKSEECSLTAGDNQFSPGQVAQTTDSLSISCPVQNQSSETLTLTPSFQDQPQADQEFTLSPNQQKTVTLEVPVPSDPGLYQSKLELLSQSQEASNEVLFSYHKTGNSALIWQVSSDDQGQVFVNWSSAKSTYRLDTSLTEEEAPKFTLTAKACGKEATQEDPALGLERMKISPEPLKLATSCNNPTLSLTVEDDQGETVLEETYPLYQKQADQAAGDPMLDASLEGEEEGSFNWLLAIGGGIALIIIIVILIKIMKDRKPPMVTPGSSNGSKLSALLFAFLLAGGLLMSGGVEARDDGFSGYMNDFVNPDGTLNCPPGRFCELTGPSSTDNVKCVSLEYHDEYPYRVQYDDCRVYDVCRFCGSGDSETVLRSECAGTYICHKDGQVTATTGQASVINSGPGFVKVNFKSGMLTRYSGLGTCTGRECTPPLIFAKDSCDKTFTFSYEAPNQAPSASITSPSSGTSATTGETVSLSGSGSDPDGDSLSYTWYQSSSCSGTAIGSGRTASTSFTTAGTKYVSLRVSDGKGGTDCASVSLSVTAGGTGGTCTATINHPILGPGGSGGTPVGGGSVVIDGENNGGNISLNLDATPDNVSSPGDASMESTLSISDPSVTAILGLGVTNYDLICDNGGQQYALAEQTGSETQPCGYSVGGGNVMQTFTPQSTLTIPTGTYQVTLPGGQPYTAQYQAKFVIQANESILATQSGVCGNGILDSGEECDDGPLNGTCAQGRTCSSNCTENNCTDFEQGGSYYEVNP